MRYKTTFFVSLLFCLFNFCVYTLNAQVRSLKLGVGPELSLNMLLPDEAEQKMSMGGGININYSAFPYFGIIVNYGFNELCGTRGDMTFKTAAWHLKSNMTYNILPNSRINPFVFVGVGILYFDPKYDNGLPLPNALAGNYQKWTAIIPFGLGINFFFAEEFSVNITGEYTIAMSDYLDDVKVVIGSGTDKYYSFKLGFSYYLFDKFYILWERDRK